MAFHQPHQVIGFHSCDREVGLRIVSGKDHIYEKANFTSGLHIELCVINPKQIKGYFLPQPLEKFNPWLHKDFASRR